jgi:hypothetical protein
MRAVLATLALALFPPTTSVEPPRGSDQVAQMARDVTDAVRKQRSERRGRSHQNQRSTEETKR